MNAQEIVNELHKGKTVVILADDIFVFMREIQRHGIEIGLGVTMKIKHGQCLMAIQSCTEILGGCGPTETLCPEHAEIDVDDVDHTMKQPLEPKW